MEEMPFKRVSCEFNSKVYEIRVYKRDDGYHVMTYQDDAPAFQHGYFCSYDEDQQYKKLLGQHGWQRLIYCAKADITGKRIYRNNPVS